jgi:hypothetical protein
MACSQFGSDHGSELIHNDMITEIKMHSKWMAIDDFSIGIGSHSMNPNTTSLPVPRGTILTWDEDSRNGNVWFYVDIDGVKHRGKVECGSITKLINQKKISLHDNGRGFAIYSGDYLQKLLNK